MSAQPEYSGIFEYLEDKYGMTAPDTPITQFYKWDISENQYLHLDGPVSSERREFPDPESAAELISEFAKAVGTDLVGFTKINENFIFKGTVVEYENCVILGKEMDYDLIQTAPDPPSGVEVLRAYWRLGDIACKVAEFIRSLGYQAQAHHPRRYVGFPPDILHTVAALEAGFGEVGRHGLLITEEYGPRVRVATITTDLELPEGRRKRFGVEEFCEGCHVCQEACQGNAIPRRKELVRGHLKYTINPYKCLEEFAKYDGCNLCVAKCVFNKRPEELKRFVETLQRK
jgi:hypothetical protein